MFTSLFFNDTAPTEIYTLSLHDALPISSRPADAHPVADLAPVRRAESVVQTGAADARVADEHAERSEEHTSELQSRQYLVCRLLLEKKQQELQRTHLNSHAANISYAVYR